MPGTSAALSAVVALLLLAGCATGPSARAARASACADWTDFPRTRSLLDAEIAARAAELKSGPIGERAKELASRRLVASAFDLLESGSPRGAVEALDAAVSLDGRNGYAWMLLAYADDSRAREGLAKAAAGLPREEGVRCELDALRAASTDSPTNR